ncbi:MAG TPA: AsmA family protein [Methylophilaceae bacterium]|nr:AsmA family protein [Methylophilaceae bacterium]
MKWLKLTGIIFVLLLVVLVTLPFFISMNDYTPMIEHRLSAKIEEPVTINNIQVRLLPTPHINVNDVTVGVEGDLKLARVVLTPDIFSILKSPYVIKDIEIDTLVINQKAIDRLIKFTKEAPSSPQATPQFRIGRLSFTNTQLSLGKLCFGPFHANVYLDGDGKLLEASLATIDTKFRALIKPENLNYSIEATAKNWTLPTEPRFKLDELSLKALATTHDIQFSKVNVKLYGGTANGQVTVNWRKGLIVNGSLDVRKVESEKIAKILSPKTHVSGLVTAKPVFSASANSVEHLMQSVHLEAPFDVQKGVLYGVDIQSAATNLIKQGATGGQTNFDHLSGHLVMANSSYQLSQLKITSGTLSVEGNVNISHEKELSGRINAQVKVAGVSTKVPLNVAGTLDSPRLYPTVATMAGAAVGTAVMGPGVGTSVGAKVGGWVDNLFGKKKK